MTSADDRTPGRLGWLVDLFRQVFSDRALISTGRYCAYNAFVGVILLAAVVLMRVEPNLGSPRAAVLAAVAGVLLIAAIPVALRRPSAAPQLLFAHAFSSSFWRSRSPRTRSAGPAFRRRAAHFDTRPG